MRELGRKIFSLDLRSLAALRIALGLVALLDIFYYRWPHAEMLLSDRGVLPLELFSQVYDASYWSFYRCSGELPVVHLLLLVQAGIALAFTLGYHTRWASVALLLLFWSVQSRNPLTNTGGDVLIRNLFAWSCLLPMGARFSLDARRRKRSGQGLLEGNVGPESWCSLASAGMVLQLVVMYFFAGLAKCNHYWFSGDALAYCFQLYLYRKPEGYWLDAIPWSVPIITWATLAIELAAPLFLLTPWYRVPARMVMLGCYWLFHLGIGLVYSIGIFSVAAASSWLMLLPGEFWDWVAGRPRPSEAMSAAPVVRREVTESERWANWLAGAMLVFMLTINLANALPKKAARELVQGLHELGRWTTFVQEYTMFGEPPLENSYYVFEAQLRNGQKVDLFSGEQPNFEPTREQIYRWALAQPWRRFLTNTSPAVDQTLSEAGKKAFAQLHQRTLDALVERWNREHPPAEAVSTAEYLYFQRTIKLRGEQPPTQKIRWASWPKDPIETGKDVTNRADGATNASLVRRNPGEGGSR